MTTAKRIADHFGVDPKDVEYKNKDRKGWYYQGYFLHKSLNEIQSCPGWVTKKIESYYNNGKKE